MSRAIRRLAGLVDGDCLLLVIGQSRYLSRLSRRSSTRWRGRCTRQGGLWIAPAAPGFDARLIGGTTVVERKDGDMLRRQMDAAHRLRARRRRPDQLERVQRELARRAERGARYDGIGRPCRCGRWPAPTLSDDPDSSQPDSPSLPRRSTHSSASLPSFSSQQPFSSAHSPSLVANGVRRRHETAADLAEVVHGSAR